MAAITPNPEQFETLQKIDPACGPVVMINLLRYRAEADYRDHPEEAPCSGREAYQRYSESAFPAVVALEGKPVWMAGVEHTFIAPEDEQWDDVVLVQWPNIAAFQKLMTDPNYHAIAYHRDAAVADSRLIITRTQFVDFAPENA